MPGDELSDLLDRHAMSSSGPEEIHGKRSMARELEAGPAVLIGMTPASSVGYGVLHPAGVADDDQEFATRAVHQVLAACRAALSPEPDDARPSPDAVHFVREAAVSFDRPVPAGEPVFLHWWVEYVGRSSFGAGFRLLSSDGAIAYVGGRLTVVKVDQGTGRPGEWSAAGRESLAALLGPDAATPG